MRSNQHNFAGFMHLSQFLVNSAKGKQFVHSGIKLQRERQQYVQIIFTAEHLDKKKKTSSCGRFVRRRRGTVRESDDDSE